MEGRGESQGLLGGVLEHGAVIVVTNDGSPGEGDGVLVGRSGEVDISKSKSDRVIKKTLKGQEYDKQNKPKSLRSGLSKWRQSAAAAERVLTDTEDVPVLKQVRKSLELTLTEISDLYADLSRQLTPEEDDNIHEKIRTDRTTLS